MVWNYQRLVYQPQTCPWCEAEFTPNRTQQIYCVDAHKQAAYKWRRRRRERAVRAQ